MGKDVKIEGEERDLHGATEEAEKLKGEEVLEDLMRVDDVVLMEREIYSMDEPGNTFLSDDVVNGSSSIFYTDDHFPPLPDFPCMSSSSSSSSLPPPTNPIFTPSSVSTVSTAPTATTSSSASSSSSSVSWAVLKSDSEDYHNRNLQSGVVVNNNINIPPIPGSLSSTSSIEIFSASQNVVPGMGVMDDFGCLDLQIDDDNDIWDPSSIFLNENNTSQQDNEQNMFVPQEHHEMEYIKEDNNFEDNSNGFDFLQGNGELSAIFLDWLKHNKDFISAEDMRSITLKRSTIESAMKRLGTSNEGKKHLLKLILDWVENCKLQKKKIDSENSLPSYHQQNNQFQDSVQNHNPDTNACFSRSPWSMAANEPTAFAPNSGGGLVAQPQMNVYQPGMGYMGDPAYAFNSYIPQEAEFQQMHNSAHHQCWQQPPHFPSHLVMPPPSQYIPFPPDNNAGLSPATPPQVGMYGNSGSQYHPYQGFDGNTDGLMRMGSSATKEARKKRMARQRRLSTHHFRHHNPSTNPHENIQNQIQVNGQQNVIRMNNNDGGLNCSSSAVVAATAPPPPVGNWVYWPPSTAVALASTNVTMIPVGSPSQAFPIDRTPVQRSVPPTTDQRQGWRTEKNLKFLLQKVLKQSDVGNLGRIVLPKKEAELHLPELESRDGIGIALEDIGTSRVWNMRYRFWPNNKSRMYLLENTGEFVRSNGLREGDFIVLYSDTKCGKYMIRGIKVRQQGLQAESKKPIKIRNIRKIAPAFNGAPHCGAITQSVQ